MNISPLASVHPDAVIGKNVTISPFAFIDKGVTIGDDTFIYPNATILEGSRIGKGCKIFPNAVIGAIPQDLKFVGEETTAEIGDYTTVRECATINRGTASRGRTAVGSHCLLMAYSHIAHDCILQNNIIIGNATQIAGEVEIDDYAILSGGCLVHQFVKIGKHIIMQGGSRCGQDVPPFIIAAREPLVYAGINVVGLRRRGFTSEQIRNIQEVYRVIYQAGLNTTQALEQITEGMVQTLEQDDIVNFIKSSSRGIIR